MYEFYPYFTQDGSVGLYSPEYNDIYHSATGALTEAYEKFILPVDMEALLKKDSIRVLDICYGIGYNSKSFLNFILENSFRKNFQNKKFSLKNFSKIFSHAKYNIAQIYTDNTIIQYRSSKILSPYIEEIESNKPESSSENFSKDDNIYTESIDTNNISPRIYIKAVDNDKILSFLSPFIRTGEKNVDKFQKDFEYKNIEKFLAQKSSRKSKPKIDKIINFLIFEKIAQNCPEIFENEIFYQILKNKKNKPFFEENIRGIFEFYKSMRLNNTSEMKISAFLHNIYYNHVSRRYKRALKEYLLADVKFELKNDDARQVLFEDKNQYDLIFLDAFTPSKCPCLWSYEFFKQLYTHLSDDGIILTYTTSATVRGAMLEAGFFIGGNFNPAKNKIMGTLATKNPNLIKYPLSEYDLGLLKTRAGIFYRDENLTSKNEAIIERRNLEVRNSNKMSSSQYQKLKRY
jgi:tRNA U34 5-methylaminomethyl-2-thiouridine-forming methyltransferase MnmC